MDSFALRFLGGSIMTPVTAPLSHYEQRMGAVLSSTLPRVLKTGERSRLAAEFKTNRHIREAMLVLFERGLSIEVEIPEASTMAYGGIIIDLTDGAVAYPIGYFMRRIRPVSLALREQYVKAFFAHLTIYQQAKIFAAERSQDCLLRLCLGKTRPAVPDSIISLRNAPVHGGEFAALGLLVAEEERTVAAMAQTLAMLHWQARLDARGVDFVLGSPLLGQHPREQTSLWLLGFERCQSISTDEAGLMQAVTAFMLDDGHFPRPGQAL